MHLAFQISRCGSFLSSIPIHNNPLGLSLETWLANCGDATSDTSPKEMIVQNISNFTWKTWRSAVILEVYRASFIQRHIFQKSRQFRLQKS
jgi:hypothetical protein